jgi:uncharacterized protein
MPYGPPMTEVRVVYSKYDGTLHWNHAARLLGEDEHGVWVGCAAGSTTRKGHAEPVVHDFAFVLLFPREAWWTALFNAPPHKVDIYCDISTVPRWEDGQVSMVDLDLDVVKTREGRIFVDDEDEFAEHQLLMSYPPEVIAQAERSAAWLTEAVTGRSGPFGGVHEEWLARVL